MTQVGRYFRSQKKKDVQPQKNTTAPNDLPSKNVGLLGFHMTPAMFWYLQ